MLKTIKALFVLLCLSQFIVAQTPEIEATIQDIREKYSKITKAKDKEQLSKREFYCEVPGGVIVFTVYSQDDKIRLIEFGDYGDPGGSGTSYYVWEDQLFFAYYTDHRLHNRIVTYDEETHFEQWHETFEITEERYYFKDEVPIRCLYKHFIDKDLKTENVPNQTMECDGAESVLESFRLLLGQASLEDEELEAIYCNE